MTMRTTSIGILLLLAMVPTLAVAQEIEATVTMNVDNISSLAQSEVASFADEMKRYIESNRWTDEEWEGPKVKMTFSVYFTGASGDGVYSARLLAGSQRSIHNSENQSPMMKILDEGWAFRYVRSQPFVQDLTRYDELTGLVDFYVYIALGLDLDSYAPNGGNAMYEKAWAIAQRAQVLQSVPGWSTDGTPGSYTRYNFIRELTDLRYSPLRKFIYNYHFNGLDNISKNRPAALDSINTYITDLVLEKDRLVQPSTIIRVLNDTKNVEYAELFRGYVDPSGLIWRKLINIDPGHKQVYDEAQDNK